MNLLTSFLKLFILFLLLVACQSDSIPLYEKEFSPKEKTALARTLKDGIFNYYQGSPAVQLLLQEAIELDPTYGTLYREAGVPYLKRGFASEYQYWYSQAVRYDPLGWQDWRGYLYLYFYRDYESAIADFNATDSLTPGIVDYPQSLSVHYLRGISYLMLQQYNHALDYFDQHIAYETKQSGFDYIDSKTFLFRGLANLGLQQPRQAMKDFITGLELNPDNANLLYQMAKLHKAAGKKQQALQYLADAQLQFAKGNHNTRSYVEEFYQLYESDLKELAESIERMEAKS